MNIVPREVIYLDPKQWEWEPGYTELPGCQVTAHSQPDALVHYREEDSCIVHEYEYKRTIRVKRDTRVEVEEVEG